MYLHHQSISLPLILDVSDTSSSSDDNLLDVNEWQSQTMYANEGVCSPRNEVQSVSYTNLIVLSEDLLPPLPESDNALVNHVNQLFAYQHKPMLNMSCDSIHQCRSLRRIISCLDFYARLVLLTDNRNRNDIINKYFADYSTLLDDYYHILSQHLNESKQIQNEMNFEIIYNECNKACMPCKTPHVCSSMDTASHAEAYNDLNVQFYMNVLHTIHMLFIHSYDAGFRVQTGHVTQKRQSDVLLYHDHELQYFHDVLAAKREQWISNKGKHFEEMNKLNHTFVQEAKTDRNRLCYFWDYYKRNGYDGYIDSKYDDLKHEMLNNKVFTLNQRQFDASYHKAMYYMTTAYAKNRMGAANQTQIYVFDEHNICEQLHYDIDEEDPISVEHMFAVILYTDYVELAYYFRKSFTSNRSQSMEEYKEKRREYWHWTKLMIECIQIHGEWIADGNGRCAYDSFYTNIRYPTVFDPFEQSLNWNGAVSFTRDLTVSWMYCDPNGYILELSSDAAAPHSLPIKLFNASFVSRFSYESEFISLRGCVAGKPLKIASIRSVNSNQNYSIFIRAMQMVYVALNGKRMNDQANKTDCRVVERLMAHKLGIKYNKYPTYVNRLFSCMINNIKCIQLNAGYIREMKLTKYFIENIVLNARNHCDIMSLERLANLCTFANAITIEMCGEKNVMSEYIWNVLVSKISAVDDSNVQYIKIGNVGNKYEANSLSKWCWDIKVQEKHDDSDSCCTYEYEFSKKENLVVKFKNMLIAK
eukprot:676571_1